MAKSFQRGTARMFKSDFLEFFSKVHPATPAVVYLPVVTFSIYMASQVSGLGALGIVWRVGVGYLMWTLLEYWLHRLVFHLPHEGPITKKIYFYVHGVHHDYPYDHHRLVMPLAVSVGLATLFFGLFSAIWGVMMWPYFAGLALGYVLYDTIHWYTHAGKPKNRILKALRRKHMIHHFKDDDVWFGVSCPWWDYVFGTAAKRHAPTPVESTATES